MQTSSRQILVANSCQRSLYAAATRKAAKGEQRVLAGGLPRHYSPNRVAHASAGNRTEQLCANIMAQGKRGYTLDLPENAHLVQRGVMGLSVHDLVELLVHHRKRTA